MKERDYCFKMQSIASHVLSLSASSALAVNRVNLESNYHGRSLANHYLHVDEMPVCDFESLLNV